jgi:hypothetical protein
MWPELPLKYICQNKQSGKDLSRTGENPLMPGINLVHIETILPETCFEFAGSRKSHRGFGSAS